MSNEIAWSYDSAETLYALVYEKDTGYIWDVGDGAFEEVGTWNDARVDECDIAMTASGDMHFADFPSAIPDTGSYFVQVRLQEGESPDTDDPPVAHGTLYWGGAEAEGGTAEEIDEETISDDITSMTGPEIYDERTSTGGEILEPV